MAYDTWFGFDLIQRKTLAKKLAEVEAAALTPEQEASLALVAAIPTADATDGVTVWNDAGTLKVSTAP